MQDSLEKNIKNRLQNHEMTPPPMAWENISNKLHKKEDKKGFIWARWMSVAAILIPAFLITTVVLINNNSFNSNYNVSNSSKNNEPQNTGSQMDRNNINKTLLEDNNRIFNEKNASTIASSKKKENKIIHFINDIFNNNDNNTTEEKQYVNNGQKNKEAHILDFLTSTFYSDTSSELPTNTIYAYASPVGETINFELFENKDNENKTEQDKNRLKFSPYAGVTMLGSLEKNSLIASEFNNLSIDNDLTATYGAKASYQVNNNFKVKTGVGVINMKQNTYDVPLLIARNSFSSQFPNSHFTKNYNLESSVSNANIHLETNANVNNAINQTNTLKQNLSQEVQFIEVPLEVEYKIAGNKRIELNASTGISSLILNKNSVYLKDNNIEFAKATNINDVSFSANAGLKLEYNITKNVSANIEPQLKYYINTISDNKDVKPYTLGINAGLSYSL